MNDRKKGAGPAGSKSKKPVSKSAPAGRSSSGGSERLQKVIAEAGLCSRRGAEKLIAEGRVAVNGRTVQECGVKVNPDRDSVSVDGRPLPPPQKLHYFMFNKPSGYLTTLSDPKGRPTIKSYLNALPVRVFPVGRLDMDVEGLLLLTNDGELAKKLMHPSTKIPKIYLVKVDGLPDSKDLEKLRSGKLMLGDRPAAPAEAELIKTALDKAGQARGWLLLTLTEGRHHQVKRMCSAVGHPVVKLKRVSYGGLERGNLRREQIRALTAAEIRQLKSDCQPSRE